MELIISFVKARKDWEKAKLLGKADKSFQAEMRSLFKNLPQQVQEENVEEVDISTIIAPNSESKSTKPTRTRNTKPAENKQSSESKASAEQASKEANSKKPKECAQQPRKNPWQWLNNLPSPIARVVGICIGVGHALLENLPELLRSKHFIYLILSVVLAMIFGPASWLMDAVGASKEKSTE
jgi:predicted ATP-grasp superfamily ATP-dependent carboligase